MAGKMIPKPTRSTAHGLADRIGWLSVFVGIVLSAVLALATSWGVGRIDEGAVAEERRSILKGIDHDMRRVREEQASSAAWDQAVLALHSGDYNWIGDNLVDRISASYDHDRVYVVAPDGNAVSSAEGGEGTETRFDPLDAVVLAPIMQRLRERMAEASERLANSTPAIAEIGVLGLDQMPDGELAIVSIRPITPQRSATLQQKPGTEFLLVSIKVIDDQMLASIADRFAIADLRIWDGGPADARVSLTSRSGRMIGQLAWTPAHPALTLIWRTAPASLTVLLLLSGCIIVLLSWLLRTTRQLETSQGTTQFLAFHDPLTGAANRAYFDLKLNEALDYHSLARTKVLLLSIDLDNFKEVNDSLGHLAGDQLIQQVVHRLSYALAEEATLARLGGDEFALVQPGIVSDGHARWISQNLLAVFDDPFDIGDRRFTVGASFGVALEHGDAVSAEELLRRADLALYAAKAKGRRRIVYYDDHLDRDRRQRRTIEVDLRNALLTGTGLFVQYQPIFDAQTGSIAGAEALVRWSHPSLGLLSPEVFINIAEQSGVIDALGLWVLEEACRVAVETNVPWIAVNVSPVQLRSDTLCRDIMTVLARHGLPATRLELEITEGVLLQNSSLVGSTLAQLRDNGIRIALDDFGTGYSSISYLRNYAVDKLKIDRSFVDLLVKDRAVRAIVQSVVEMGKALDMTVTAEGVENEEQHHLLTQLGCHYLQGYLLSRPVSADQLQSLMGGRSPVAVSGGGHRQ